MPLTVSVRLPSDRPALELTVTSGTTVLAVKAMVQAASDIPTSRQFLVFGIQALEDGARLMVRVAPSPRLCMSLFLR